MPAPSPSASDLSRSIPVTIHPGQDVHLRTGLPLGSLRDTLAGVTGRDELRRGPLHVGDRALDDHHVVGQPPLLAGAVLRRAPEPPDPCARALEAPLHLAHRAGPRAGFVQPLVTEPAGASSETTLVGVTVRVRRGRRNGLRVRIRPSGHHRVSLVDGTGRARPVGPARARRWTLWKPGASLETTDTTGAVTSVELRRRPRLADVTFSALTRDLVEDAVGRGPHADPPSRSTAATLWTALLPAVASVALAVALRNPIFALMAVVGPLVVLGPHVARRRRERLAGGGLPDPSEHAPASRPCPRAGLRPVDLLTAALASGAVPRRELLATDDPRTRPRRTLTGPHGASEDRLVLAGDLPGGCLAVVGPREAALAHAARTVVALHATGRVTRIVVLASPDRTAAWAWSRWIPGSSATTASERSPLPPGPGTLLVVDAAARTPGLNARLGAWHAAHGEHGALLVLDEDAASVPSWCSAVAAVTTTTVTWSVPGHATEHTPFDGVGPRWLDEYARRVGALTSVGRWSHVATELATGPRAGARPALPTTAPLVDALADVLGEAWHPPADPADGFTPLGSDAQGPLVAAISRRWANGGHDLSAPVGVGTDGETVVVDLLTDGPHALVAGTTGAGKSELLQTLVLALALRSSPDDLAIALVDYKGGAGFGACVDLPHVVGQVTDLDPGIAERALDGLRAELRRRERLFAVVGASNLDAYRSHPDAGERLPRLLVVVDEFRAMADDHPQFIPGLVRIAAQGRSLGVHLVLATQRPSGAITPDMRANISLRVALRVVDGADSGDIIDSPDAAAIPADTPGRALLRRGLAAPVLVQTFHAGGSPTGAERTAFATPRWDAQDDLPWSFPVPAGHATPAARDPARVLVDAARSTARALAVPRPRVPWTPELPARLSWDTLASAPGTRTRLALGVADHPEEQRHAPFLWDLEAGHLLVVGRAGTGRTTALRTVAHAARAAGCVVHLVGPATVVPGSRHGVATVVDRSDPRRVARLLTLLLSATPPEGPRQTVGDSDPATRHVLVIDGLEDVQRALGSMHRGAGAELLTSLFRDGAPRGVHVAVSAAGTPSSTVSALLNQRILFSGREKHDDAYLGIPTGLAGRGGAPGRAVFIGAGPATRCQVAVTPEAGPRAPDGSNPSDAPGAVGPDLLRWTVEPVPHAVHVTELTPGDDELLSLGRGGDHATVTGLPLGAGLLVCGPHGSGRSATLALVARALASDVALAAVLSRDAGLAAVAATLGCPATLSAGTPRATADFVENLARLGAERTDAVPTTRQVVIVDDLDAFAQTCPAALDAVQRFVEGYPGTVVVASATTAAAAGAFRGLLADLRAVGRGIVLDPGTPGSSEVFGVDLGWLVEPDVHVPGRGVLVEGRRTSLVQLAHTDGHDHGGAVRGRD